MLNANHVNEVLYSTSAYCTSTLVPSLNQPDGSFFESTRRDTRHFQGLFNGLFRTKKVASSEIPVGV